MSLNRAQLIGNVGKDPDVQIVDGGRNPAKLARFSLATSERYVTRTGDVNETVEWHNIVCWRELAERAERTVTKGAQLFLEGRICTRQYTDQQGVRRSVTEIVADSFQILSAGREKGAPAENGQENNPA